MLLQMHYNSYTQQQIDYVEKFICDNSRMTYMESYAFHYFSLNEEPTNQQNEEVPSD